MPQQERPRTVATAEVKRRIARVGVWTFALGRESASFERAAATELEDLGFGALWVGELHRTKEALSHSALLLDGSRRLMVATGIANIWAATPPPPVTARTPWRRRPAAGSCWAWA